MPDNWWSSFALASADPIPSEPQTGKATWFGGQKDKERYDAAIKAGKSVQQALKKGDPGIGTPALGAVSSTNSYGVAVPTDYLRNQFGPNPEDWRKARADVTIGGQTVRVPYIDVGPSKQQTAKGVVTDISYPLSKALGMADLTDAKIAHVPNAGPDYVKDPTLWYNEQAKIAQDLGQGDLAQTTPSPTPSLTAAPAPQTDVAQAAPKPAETAAVPAPAPEQEAAANWWASFPTVASS